MLGRCVLRKLRNAVFYKKTQKIAKNAPPCRVSRFATKSSKSDFGGRFGLSLPEHSLWSFNHSEMIMVWKMFYFFQKSQKFSKKGLGRGIRTHMAHLKFLLAGSAVKIENFLGFSPASWSVPIGCKYSPQALFGAFLAAKMLQDAFPDDIDRLQKIWILVISGPKQAFFAPKLGTRRNFCPHLEAYSHVPDVRTYFIRCEGV